MREEHEDEIDEVQAFGAPWVMIGGFRLLIEVISDEGPRREDHQRKS